MDTLTAMNSNLDQLLPQRERILQQIRSIDRLRRGSFSRQFLQQRRRGNSGSSGPYYLLQGFLHGKKFSQRVPAQQAEQVQQQVAHYRRFQSLAEEFVTLTDQITRLESELPDSKKNSSRRSSPTNGSAKPKPS